MVALGLVAVVVGALVVAHVVPQPALLATSMTVFLLTGVVSRRFDDLGALALGAVVVGLSWSFGLWCSFRDFPLWPGLAGAAAVIAVVAVAARVWRGDALLAHRRLLVAQTVMMVLMVLSWGRFKRGALGVAVSLLFVGWGAMNLFTQLALALRDAHDAHGVDGNAGIVRAASILRAGADVCWNALVTAVRLLPDDEDGDEDGDGGIFG